MGSCLSPQLVQNPETAQPSVGLPGDLTDKRRLTPQQAKASAEAAEKISAIALALEKVPEAERAPPLTNSKESIAWDAFDGARITAMLSHTPLVDLEWLVMLIQLGGIMPAGLQSVPRSAVITPDNVWRLKLWNKKRMKFSLGILVFSYPWLDWFHPDRVGAQLRRLLPFLEAMLAEAKCDSPHCTVGVMIDFLCLPQKPFTTEDEKTRFRVSLSNINEWYYHKSTYVLLVTSPPPEGTEYGNTRLHEERGWCHFEKAAAMAVKKAWCLLDWSAYKDANAFCGSKGNDPDSHSCIGQMKAGREPPISPAVFAEQMRRRVASGALTFTAQADMDFVIGQYETGFVSIMSRVAESDECVRSLSFQNLGWGDDESAVLREALRYAATHCDFPHGAVKVYCKKGNFISAKRWQELESDEELKGKFVLA